MSWSAEVRELLAELFGQKKEPEEKPKAAPRDARDGLKEIRAHLRHVGAALAAGATALIVGLGWVQLHNVFPAPADRRVLVPLIAFASCAAALVGVGWLTRIIFAAQRQIPMASDTEDLGHLGSLNEREKGIRDKVFKSVAEEHQAESLRELELEARRFQRMAEDAQTPTDKDKYQAKSTRMLAAVDEAAVGAAVLILEERSGNVFRGPEPIAAFLLAAVGIIVAFGVADYSKGQRDLIALRKSCAEASAAGATDACKGIVDGGPGSDASSKNGATSTAIAIGVRRIGPRCAVSVRVDGKPTRATTSGPATLTIDDRARLCGVLLRGGGLTLRSGLRHTGTTTAEVRLKPLSYSLLALRSGATATVGEQRLDPIVAAP